MATPQYVGGGSGFPRTVILTMPLPMNQGTKQSCVSVTTGYYVCSFYKFLRESNNARTSDDWYSKAENVLSPEFLYNQLRRNYCDRGTAFIENLDLLQSDGVCSMALMPYNGEACGTKPTKSAIADALNNKIKTYQKVNKNNLSDIKYFLINRMPVLIGIRADEGLLNLQKPFILTGQSGEVLGNHAVTLVGYSDDKQAFLAINSWGRTWADNGCFWISYVALAGLVVNDEIYVITQPFTFARSNIDLSVHKVSIYAQSLVTNSLFHINRRVRFDIDLVNKGIEGVSLNTIEVAFIFSKDNVLDEGDLKPLYVSIINSTSKLAPNRYVTLVNWAASTPEAVLT